jgi:hypothetical protein
VDEPYFPPDSKFPNNNGKPPGGKPPAGKAPAGKAPAGKAPAGKAPAGKAPAGKAPAGKAPAGKPPGHKPSRPKPKPKPGKGGNPTNVNHPGEQHVRPVNGQHKADKQPGRKADGKGFPTPKRWLGRLFRW